MNFLDLKDYGPKSNTRYRYNLVLSDKFSKFAWNVPMKIEKTQTLKDSLESILQTSKKNHWLRTIG